MGGSVLPAVGGALVSGIFGKQAADKQAGAMSDAQAQAAAAQMQAARLQNQFGEKGLLAQLYMAQMANRMQQQQMRMALESEARALEAVEPYRRIGYAALPDLYDLQQRELGREHTPLSVKPPPELTQMFGQEQQDLERQLGRRLALQGIAGSPIASNLMGDQLKRLYSDQTARGYTAGLQKSQIEDARQNALRQSQWGRTSALANLGSSLGTQGYGIAGGQMPNMASMYGNLGSNLASGLSRMGAGQAGAYSSLGSMYGASAPAMGSIAGSPWANWANQIGAVLPQLGRTSTPSTINTGFGTSYYQPASNTYSDPYYSR